MIKFSRLQSLFVFGVTLCLVLICSVALGQSTLAQNPLTARAVIEGAGISGILNFVERDTGAVKIWGRIQGDPAILTPGLHGLHIHSVGVVCDSPTYLTSGGHFDPGPFGSEIPVEENHPYHMGDLPNLVVDERGYAIYNAQTSRVTLSDSPLTLFDDNGSAIIIHQFPDLQKAKATALEAGGPRLACGIVTRN